MSPDHEANASTGGDCTNLPANIIVGQRGQIQITTQERETTPIKQESTYKLSRQRWLILFAVSSCGLLAGLSGQFSSILRVMLELLDLPRDDYVYISQAFMYLPAISSMPTAWFIDQYGLRQTMYAATILIVARGFFRTLLFLPNLTGWRELKLFYWISSGILNAQTAAIFMCLPLKISENWFSKSERSFAWTVMISSIDVGTTIASFSYPRLVDTVDNVGSLACFNSIGSLIVALIVFAFVTRSNPKYPPSERMQTKRQQNSQDHQQQCKKPSWLASLKELLKQRQIMLHLIHRTVFASVAISPGLLMQDILVSSGHSEIFVGNLLAINSSMSVLMLIALSTLVHRVKNLTLACKLASLAESMLYTVHLLTILYPIDERPIVLVTVVFIVVKCWKQPNITEMTGHLINGSNISEATISAVSATVFISMTIMTQLMFVNLIRKRPDGSSDYADSIVAASVVCLANSLTYFIFFEGSTHLPSPSRSQQSNSTEMKTVMENPEPN